MKILRPITWYHLYQLHLLSVRNTFSDLKRIFEYDTETLSKTEVDTVLSVDREEQEATESDITSIEDEDFTEERQKEQNIEMTPTIPQDWVQK